jgi:Caspase domain
MTTHRTLAGLLLALLLGIGSVASAQTIHLLTIADTNDLNIGSGTTGNTRRVADFINRAAAEMKVTVSRQDVSGNGFSCTKIAEAIGLMQAGPDDVVIFYYSGHGFRTDDNVTKFPDLYCGAEAFSGGAPRLVNVAADLAKKGARLTIVVADSCNVLATQPLPPRPAAAFASIPVSREKQYRHLFFGYKGMLTMSGSVSGQFSWYMPDYGLFTDQLLKALDAATQPSRQGLWSEVLPLALAEIRVPYGTGTIPQNPESESSISLKP